MDHLLLTRRQFSHRLAASGLSLSATGAMLAVQGGSRALAAANPPPTDSGPKVAARTVKLPDGTPVTALGQGAWHLGQGRHPPELEEQALEKGVALGMNLIDTSGNYGNGRSEELISHVLAGGRDRIFLVSKVEKYQISGNGIANACDASLARLGTDHLDLYLLHWPVAATELAGVVAAFEQLRAAGKIRAWGVSNFDVALMEELFRVPDGHHCATNQVPYSLANRRLERDMLPWCAQHRLPMMAYSPLGGDRNLLVTNPTVTQIAAGHSCPASAVALAWAIRSGSVIAIPESGSPPHVEENARALSITLTPQDLQALDAAFP